MDIKTLESFKLSDAIKFHDELNPKLWRGNRLDPAVKLQLKAIAEDFLIELGIKDLAVADITVSGSNAAYTYTPHSDLDLHILVDMNKLPNDEIYRELFNAKKTIYNDSHDIKIKGVPVELYVQDSNEPVVSLGEYSILNDKWLKLPTKRRANLDQTAAKAKYEKLYDIIQRALRAKDSSIIDKTLKKIKQYRKAGLDTSGEFGPENLAFKAIRSQGLLTKLYALRDKLHSEKLSIESMYSQNEDYHPNAKPRGPEFKPTMPKGTVRVDVSDVYDWYKLGQHISNLKGLGKHDFGKGPPSTILSFGDEDTEHQYIKDLEKTGLTTTDIDPVDPNQPKGMKRQKVDPTFNVNEKINPNIVEKDFRAEKTIDIKDVGPLKLEAYNISTEYPQQFRVDVSTPDGNKIGHFRFVVQDYESEPKYKVFSLFKKKGDPYLVAGNVSVWNEFQRKGIATEVYKWIKSMGNDIKPSPHQTDAGQAMWRGFEKNKTIDESSELKGSYDTEEYNGILMSIIEGEDGFKLWAKTPKGEKLGFVEFWFDTDGTIRAEELEVYEKHRGKGIAKAMYDYVKSLGFKIARSSEQTPDGAAFWDKHKPGKKVWEQGVSESASGYIPSNAEKNDPRFKTALTVDVKPDTMKKDAKKFGNNISRAGIPPTLKASGKI